MSIALFYSRYNIVLIHTFYFDIPNFRYRPLWFNHNFNKLFQTCTKINNFFIASNAVLNWLSQVFQTSRTFLTVKKIKRIFAIRFIGCSEINDALNSRLNPDLKRSVKLDGIKDERISYSNNIFSCNSSNCSEPNAVRLICFWMQSRTGLLIMPRLRLKVVFEH